MYGFILDEEDPLATKFPCGILYHPPAPKVATLPIVSSKSFCKPMCVIRLITPPQHLDLCLVHTVVGSGKEFVQGGGGHS